MKKALLTLGAIAAVATPIAAVISCGISETRYTVPEYTRDETSDIYSETAFLNFVNSHKGDWIRVKEVKWYNAEKTQVDRYIVLMKVPEIGFVTILDYESFKNDPANIPNGNVEITKQ